jgi:hypothetical protein
MKYNASMSKRRFEELVTTVTNWIGNRPLDGSLEEGLNANFPANGEFYTSMLAICTDGAAEGWICEREAGGIRYGRVLKASPEIQNFSVDVVDMNDVVGPHHVHPSGEVDLIMPISGDAKFDNHGAGWLVYECGSAHKPAVAGGRAFVLYLLPNGAIEFTRS